MNRSSLNMRLYEGRTGDRLPARSTAYLKPPDSQSVGATNPFLKYLLYRWATILFVGGFLAAVLAAAAWYLIPSKFTTSSLIRISAEIPSLTVGDINNRADFSTYLKTQAAMIRSYGVLHIALLDPKIASLPMIREQSDPVAFLMEELKLDYQDGSELLRIQLSGDDPQAITQIVNAVQDAYFREVVEDEQRRKKLRLNRLEETVHRMKDEVETRQKLVPPGTPLKVSSQVVPQLAANQVVRIKEMLANSDSAIRAQEDKITGLQKRFNQPRSEWIDPPNILDLLDRDTDIQKRNERMQSVQIRIDEYKRVFQNLDTTQFKELQEKLIEETKLRDELREKKLNEYRAAHIPLLSQQLKRQYDEAKELLAQQRHYKRELEKQLSEYQGMLDSELASNEKPLDYTVLEIQDRQNIITNLIDRSNLLRIELDAPARVRPLQPAIVPQKRDYRRQILGSIVAALFGFGLISFSVVAYESALKRTTASADLTRLAPILGVIPEVLNRPRVEESLDKLRGLLVEQVSPNSRLIVVSSAREEDGKNYLSWQLALSFERAGVKTLLVDFDLRQPRLHRFCKTDNDGGVCDLLIDNYDVRAHIRTAPDGLAFLPAGVWCDLVRRELVPDRLESFFQRLRQAFDVIVVNTHPVLNVAETYPIAKFADAILLSVKKHHSRLELIERAKDKIVGLTPSLFGLVLNGGNENECWN